MPPRRRPTARILTPAGWAWLVALSALILAIGLTATRMLG